MDLKETYNRIAEDWHEDHKQDTWWTEGTDKFVALLKPGDLVLDVGCGAGTKSKYLTSRGLKIVGIDFSEKMIEIAKREAPEGEFQVMDMQEVGELASNYNGIFIQAALLHIRKSQAKEVLEKLLGKLEKDGFMYIAVKEKKLKVPAEEVLKEEDYGYPYERFFSYYTLEDIKGYLEELQMKIVYETVTPSGNTKWIQVIAQK